jgi:hypothetical protein
MAGSRELQGRDGPQCRAAVIGDQSVTCAGDWHWWLLGPGQPTCVLLILKSRNALPCSRQKPSVMPEANRSVARLKGVAPPGGPRMPGSCG